MTINALKNQINAVIKANGNNEITGPILNKQLIDLIDDINDLKSSVYRQATYPTIDLQVNDILFKTDTNTLEIYNGSTWDIIPLGGDTTGLVPYTGATSDVDLGTYGITVNNLKVTTLLSATTLGTDITGNIIDNSATNFFDCTIGTGGNYPNVAEAQADNRTKWKIISNITLNADISLDNVLMAADAGIIIETGSYYWSGSDGVIIGLTGTKYTSQFTIKVNSTINFQGFKNCGARNVRFESTASASYAFFTDAQISECYFKWGDIAANYIAAGKSTLTDCIIKGGGISCYNLVNAPVDFIRCEFRGIFSLASTTIQFDCNFTDCKNDDRVGFATIGFSTKAKTARNFRGTPVAAMSGYWENSNVKSRVYPSTNRSALHFKNCIGEFDLQYLSNNCPHIFEFCTLTMFNGISPINYGTYKFINNTINYLNISVNDVDIVRNEITGALTVGGDNYNIDANRIVGATVLSLGVTDSIITNNRFAGGFTDNSGNATNITANNK